MPRIGPKPPGRDPRSGFTLPEILIGTAIFLAGVGAWVEMSGRLTESSRRGIGDYQLASEQRALKGLISAVPKTAVDSATCTIPHPWVTYKAGDCAPAEGVDFTTVASPTEVAAWRELSLAVMAWPGAEKLNKDTLNPKLNKAYYTSKVVPAMQKAGCMMCHGAKPYSLPKEGALARPELSSDYMKGNAPQVYQRDFHNPDHMVDPFPYTYTDSVKTVTVTEGPGVEPLAKRAIVLSALGQKLMLNRFEASNMLANSTANTNFVTFQKETIKIALQTYRSLARARTNWACTDKLPAASPQGPCEKMEFFQAFTCQSFCAAWNPPPICSCGKDCQRVCPGAEPTCARWDSTFSCLSTSDVNIEPHTGIAHSTYNPGGGYAPSGSWQALSDSACANAPASVGGPWCGGISCKGAVGAKACVQADSCRRTCTTPTWSAGKNCGKDCFIPPEINGCDIQQFELVCRQALEPTYMDQPVLKFSIDSSYFDPQYKTFKNVNTMGVIE